MLVSSIARFNAASNMNNAAFGIMQCQAQMGNAISNSTFGGENNLSALHEMDKQLSLDLASNKLLYYIASLQEKWAGKQQDKEVKKSFSVIA